MLQRGLVLASGVTLLKRLMKRIRYSLPEGLPLPDRLWKARHQGILALLWLHAVGLFWMGLIAGQELGHVLLESGLVAAAAVLARVKRLSRRMQAAIASLGLITSSAVLVHIAGGVIEMHFHFFVMVTVIALYQDWGTLLLTIGYVVVHHGVIGVLFPQAVYNHPDAWANPWKWAFIHAAFVVGACLASLVNWRMAEAVRAQSDLLVNSVGEGIYVVDLDGQTDFVNPAAAALLGWQREKLLGQPVATIMGLHPGTGLAEDLRQILAGMPGSGSTPARRLTTFIRQDGSSFPGEYTCLAIHDRGRLIGAVITFLSVVERHEAEDARARYLEARQHQLAEAENRLRLEQHAEELQALSLLDDLTQLYNRRGFISLAQQHLTMIQQSQEQLWLIFADMDDLKQINDSFSHQEGNRAIADLALILKQTFRELDVVARVGGDEFVVLAAAQSAAAIQLLMERFASNLQQFNTTHSRPYHLSVSIGIASYDPEHPCSLEELITRADMQMYEQKRARKVEKG